MNGEEPKYETLWKNSCVALSSLAKFVSSSENSENEAKMIEILNNCENNIFKSIEQQIKHLQQNSCAKEDVKFLVSALANLISFSKAEFDTITELFCQLAAVSEGCHFSFLQFFFDLTKLFFFKFR